MDTPDYLDCVMIFKNIQERVEKITVEELLATLAPLWSMFEEILGTHEKSVSNSEVLRKRGNVLFSSGDYENAALVYAASLMNAPPHSESAAMAYANRSAALNHLKKYKECILDIDRALDLPYPNNLRPKIIERKEYALAQINDESETETTVEHVDDMKVVHGESSELPGASRGIDVAYNPQEGRKLIAKMPFQPGDILVIEKPFISVRSLVQSPRNCHHCLKSCMSVIPCAQCCVYAYCSEECRAEAYDKYHSIECKILGKRGNSFFINKHRAACNLRYLIILTEGGINLKALNDVLEEIEKNTDHIRLGFTGEQFIGHSTKGFLSLPGKQEKTNWRMMVEAVLLIMLLKNRTNFFKRNDDIPIAAKLMIKIYAIHAANMLPIPTSDGKFTAAWAIYPLISLAKHACVNNTIVHVKNDGSMVLRASQSIRPGEEIQWNYCDVKFLFRMVNVRSGQAVECIRICDRCDKKFVYPAERHLIVEMTKKLRAALAKNPYEINILWKLLGIVSGRHQRYTLQAQVVKKLLVDAYEGRCDSVVACEELRMAGIL
ncbi:uncharacterized protein LOC112694895 [Athalia rosae]|uniref:uncharacterized protein LOC112694895 n=1 Tax=Athalia rosae TaxID=37344 RepID=UPI00203378A1|nr:uncharacterized protein LOC112694895 [Athalia rosae]